MTASRLRNRIAISFVATTMVVMSSCGTSTSSSGTTSSKGTQTSPLTLTGSNRHAQLLAGAKKEGHVTWLTALAGPAVAGIVKGFEKTYPGITVNYVREAAPAILTQTEAEARSNHYTWDLAEPDWPTMVAMKGDNLLAPYYSPEALKQPSSLVLSAGGKNVWSATQFITYVGFGYNTQLLPSSAVPKTYQQEVNPALKGKVGLPFASAVYWIGGVIHEMGLTKAKQFFAQMESVVHPKVEGTSAAAVAGLVGDGQLASSLLIFIDHAKEQQAAGKPFAFVPISPVPALSTPVSVNKHAPDPYAAMLFLDYLISQQGQQLMHGFKYLTADSPSLPSGLWFVSPTTVKTADSELKLWTDLEKQYFGIG